MSQNTMYFSLLTSQILLAGRIINLIFFGEVENQVDGHRINGCAWKKCSSISPVISKPSNGASPAAHSNSCLSYYVVPQLEPRANMKVRPVCRFGLVTSDQLSLNDSCLSRAHGVRQVLWFQLGSSINSWYQSLSLKVSYNQAISGLTEKGAASAQQFLKPFHAES